jgi:SRSO17 transposase
MSRARSAEGQRHETARAAIGEVNASDLLQSIRRIRDYVAPYAELLSRSELRRHATAMITGLTSDLERKSVELIAVMQGIPRERLQWFVGGSEWAWTPLLDRLRREVTREIGIADGSLILDGSATPKKGVATVGVARQWCGRLGKRDNCVVGVYAAYVGRDDAATLVDCELFLPREWVDDPERRTAVNIPSATEYRAQPAIAKAMVEGLATKLPFTWVLADDEFGRAQAIRDTVRTLKLNCIVDVPKNTVVRRRRSSDQALCRRRWEVQDIVRQIPKTRWSTLVVRDAEKGPVTLRAAMIEAATERERRKWVAETLVAMDMLDERERSYCLAHAPAGTSLEEFVRRAKIRPPIEEVLEEAKGEVGLDHFETRTWQGWHHHMTLSLMAHWFLLREKRRLGKKVAGLTIGMVRRAVGWAFLRPTAGRAASFVNYQLRRNEEAREGHYRVRGLTAPPRSLATG